MMETFPAFFDDAPVIRMRDPLAILLGTSANGIFDYRYHDAVRLAGHSCPTVAGAFLMVRAGLNRLCPEDIPERGSIGLAFPGAAEDGMTGVIASIASFVTGARGEDGFKGIAGEHDRRELLRYAKDMRATMGISCRGRQVRITYRPQAVPPDLETAILLQLITARAATENDREEFGRLWQDRVRKILINHADDPDLIHVEWA